ncbi:hypothetical protein B0H34DRAFT_672987 [Crassisporium funariophilum]|nr:hypothetical protein B0H34DRAFT_672987 [Crassisporium funariophilum]
MTRKPNASQKISTPAKTQRGIKRKGRDDTTAQSSSDANGNAKKLKTSSGRPTSRVDQAPHGSQTQLQVQPPGPQTRKAKDVPKYIPDTAFYYEDGDVFATIGLNLFCVHIKTLLSAGGIFTVLLNSPLVRPSEEEIIFGLPCIPVYNISVREFRFLLAHLYRTAPVDRHLRNGTRWLFWESAVTLLKVAKVLDLEIIHQDVIKALKTLLPNTAERKSFRPTIAGLRNKNEEKMFSRTYPMQAIKLIHEYDLPAMLPMAYYHAAQLSIEDILTGVKDGDVLWKLDSDDVLRVIEGRENLKLARREDLFSWMPRRVAQGLIHSSCISEVGKSGRPCQSFLNELSNLYNQTGYLDLYPTALESFTPEEKHEYRDYLCGRCWREIQEMYAVCLQATWAKLPSYFGLQDWDAVTAAQDHANKAWDGRY